MRKADHIIPLLKTLQWFPYLFRISQRPYRGRQDGQDPLSLFDLLSPSSSSLTALQPHRDLGHSFNTLGSFSPQRLLFWPLCLEPSFPQVLAWLTPSSLRLCSASCFWRGPPWLPYLKWQSRAPNLCCSTSSPLPHLMCFPGFLWGLIATECLRFWLSLQSSNFWTVPWHDIQSVLLIYN